MNSKLFLLFTLFFLAVLAVSVHAAEDEDTNDHNDGDGDDHSKHSPEPDETAEASSDADDEVCVDAKYLTSFPAHTLVHTTAIRAAVLCPQSSSLPCATADHMVRVNGMATSYRELCNRAGVACESKRMAVNSVLSHLWEETTHDDGVSLTMLDARHPETLQKMMHRAIAVRRSIARVFA